jgi:hypothetical protein
MNQTLEWYRSNGARPDLRVGARRQLRNWIRSLLPEPDVRGRMMVLHSRRTFPKFTPRGFRSEFHGLFSEFHSVLGALQYAETYGAAGVRVHFRSPLYDEPARGPNWWTYFFESDTMRIPRDECRSAPEVSLDGVLTKYGRYGGFSDIIGGTLAHLYPVSYGIDRASLYRLVATYIRVRPEILEEVQRFISERFDPGALVVGVRYRGEWSDAGWAERSRAIVRWRTQCLDAVAALVVELRMMRSTRRFRVRLTSEELGTRG